MTIYLIDAETNEITRTFNNVKSWGSNFVLYNNGGYLGKICCDIETEYFTDINPTISEETEEPEYSSDINVDSES